jgi:homoserine kinase
MSELQTVKVYAPASVANLGPGFDAFGLALKHPGDMAVAHRSKQPGVNIRLISGDDGSLPLEVDKNTAGIAASRVLEMLSVDEGVELELFKGIPGRSGLGSSGTSAVAGAYAVNILFGGLLTKEELIQACLDAETVACGEAHGDNVAASLLGGFVVVRRMAPLVVEQLTGLDDLSIVLVHPDLGVAYSRPTRSSLPRKIELDRAARNWANAAVMGYAFARKDLDLFCSGIQDNTVEQHRTAGIPGYFEVCAAARASGALACALSGAGPTVFAIVSEANMRERVGEAMKNAFLHHGCNSQVYHTSLNPEGVMVIE